MEVRLPRASSSANLKKIAIFLQSGDPDSIRNAASMIAGAAALNWEVVVVLLSEALRRHVQGSLDPDGKDAKEPDHPEALVRSAREFGNVTLLACSADARKSGLKEARIRKKVDEILGMSTILRRVADAGTKLWI